MACKVRSIEESAIGDSASTIGRLAASGQAGQSFLNVTKVLAMTIHCLLRVTGLLLGLLVPGQFAYGQAQPAAQAADRPVPKPALRANEPAQFITDVSIVDKDPAQAALARAAAKRAARQKVLDSECVIKDVMSNIEIQNCNRAK